VPRRISGDCTVATGDHPEGALRINAAMGGGQILHLRQPAN